jgi:hypothetical protein
MTYKALKKVTKNYDTKFTKETSTLEMQLTFGNCKIIFSEQQFGERHFPQVYIMTSKGTYVTQLKDLILKLIPDASVTNTSLL